MKHKFKNIINNMSVGQKVLSIIFLEIISYSVVTTIALSQINSVGNVVKQMSDLYLPLFSSSETIRLQIQESRLNLKDIIFVGDRVVYDKDAEESYIAAYSRYQENNHNINEEINWADKLIMQASINEDSDNSLIKEYSEGILGQLSSVRQASRIHNVRAEKVFRHVEDGSFLMGMEIVSDVTASEKTLIKELDALVNELRKLKSSFS